jgi:hypothetical protein
MLLMNAYLWQLERKIIKNAVSSKVNLVFVLGILIFLMRKELVKSGGLVLYLKPFVLILKQVTIKGI